MRLPNSTAKTQGLLARSSTPCRAINPSLIVRKNMQLFGSVFWEPKHLHRVIQLLSAHNESLSLQDAVTHRYGLAESTSALEDVEALKCVKAVIDPTL